MNITLDFGIGYEKGEQGKITFVVPKQDVGKIDSDRKRTAMRKAQKKQAEDFVELLGQAHDEIRKEIEKKNIPTVLSLLADCQEGAMSLGELIEKTEGEDAATIPLLE